MPTPVYMKIADKSVLCLYQQSYLNKRSRSGSGTEIEEAGTEKHGQAWTEDHQSIVSQDAGWALAVEESFPYTKWQHAHLLSIQGYIIS